MSLISQTDHLIFFSIPKWKLTYLPKMLGKNNEQKSYVFNFDKLKKFNFSKKSKIIVWGNYLRDELDDLKKKIQVPVYRIEDGFIRSFGLGSNLIRPLSLVIDSRGIYYDTQRDNDLSYYLNNTELKSQQLEQAERLQKVIVNNNICKYNCQPIKYPNWKTGNKKIILIPGQVEDDASIKYGALDIKTNLQLLKKVRDLNKNAYIVYKPHPDILASNRKGFVDKKDILKIANYFEESISILSCINRCDEIHTMTSLSGFEGLIRGKKVFAYGRPFYFPYLLNNNKNKLKKSLLLKLIYCTFISYQKINIEVFTKLSQNKKFIENSALKVNFFSKIINLFNFKNFKKNF